MADVKTIHNSKEWNPDFLFGMVKRFIRNRDYKSALERGYNKDLFEKALYLKKIKNSLKDRQKRKIEVKGKLKENLSYKNTLEGIFGYCFIGIFVLFFLLGIVVLVEAILNPSLVGALSVLFLITFGTCALIYVLYWNYFKKEVI